MPTSSQPSLRRAFWQGLLLNVAFRAFAYGIVWLVYATLFENQYRPIKFTHTSGSLVFLLCLSSLCVVPLSAGFLSGYFWRRIDEPKYTKGVYGSVGAFALVAGAFFIYLSKWESLPYGILLFPIDVVFCLMGVGQGKAFWKSRLSRQFFGDFSTRDEEG